MIPTIAQTRAKEEAVTEIMRQAVIALAKIADSDQLHRMYLAYHAARPKR